MPEPYSKSARAEDLYFELDELTGQHAPSGALPRIQLIEKALQKAYNAGRSEHKAAMVRMLTESEEYASA